MNRKLTREESDRPRRIDDEVGMDVKGRAVSMSRHVRAISIDDGFSQLSAIPIVDAGGDRLSHEMMIDVGAEPVRVRHCLGWTGGDQQPLLRQIVALSRGIGVMPIEGEPTFEP